MKNRRQREYEDYQVEDDIDRGDGLVPCVAHTFALGGYTESVPVVGGREAGEGALEDGGESECDGDSDDEVCLEFEEALGEDAEVEEEDGNFGYGDGEVEEDDADVE
jgi:hypothetical protein